MKIRVTMDSDGVTSNGAFTVGGVEADASWEYSVDGGAKWAARQRQQFHSGTGPLFEQ